MDDDGDVACMMCGNMTSAVDVRRKEADGDGRGRGERAIRRVNSDPQWVHMAPICVYMDACGRPFDPTTNLGPILRRIIAGLHG